MRVAVFRPELHSYRHACRTNRDGRFPGFAAEAVAAETDYAVARHYPGRPGNRNHGRRSCHLAIDLESGGPELPVTVCRCAAHSIYWRPHQDGRIHAQ